MGYELESPKVTIAEALELIDVLHTVLAVLDFTVGTPVFKRLLRLEGDLTQRLYDWEKGA